MLMLHRFFLEQLSTNKINVFDTCLYTVCSQFVNLMVFKNKLFLLATFIVLAGDFWIILKKKPLCCIPTANYFLISGFISSFKFVAKILRWF